MKLKILLSLVLITGMLFISSCGEDEKQPELESVESVDALIEDLDSTEADAVKTEDVVIAETPADAKEVVKTPAEEVVESTPVAKAGEYLSKPLEGTIVSLNDITMGGSGKVTKDEAKALASKGNLILFKATNGTVYFVYNEDGTFASKRLAGYANNTKVGILGTAKVIDGLNVFIMNMIEGM